jgi:hypothetical protein
MGSQRRILGALEEMGITGTTAHEALEAVETLNSAGDDFSDALYEFLELGNPKESLSSMQEVLAKANAAVETLTRIVNENS